MPEFTFYAQGTPQWVDLATTDVAEARAFYSELFGWSFVVDTGDWGSYIRCLVDGKSVAGMADQQQDERDQGVPPHWVTYVAVDSADDIAARVTDAGGVVIMPPMDVLTEGRMLVAQDPAGAFTSFWESKDHIGAQLANEPGTLVWNELQVHDVDAAKAFYETVLGIETETSDMGGGVLYTTFQVQGRSVAGMMQIQKEWGPVPPHWDVYFGVEDTDATVERVKSLGGEVLVPAMDIPNVGRFAGLKDPQGAMFYVIKGQ
jgi:uncharacterized protein